MDALSLAHEQAVMKKSWYLRPFPVVGIASVSGITSIRAVQPAQLQAQAEKWHGLILRSPNSPSSRRRPVHALRWNSHNANEAAVEFSVEASIAPLSEGDVASAAPSLLSPTPMRAVEDLPRTWTNPRVAENPKGSVQRQPYKLNLPSDVEQPKEGLGIVDFLRGKHIFITGCTGFLAKVLVEKILREQPEIGQLYLLIQPRNNKSPEQRLEDDVLNSRLFEVLREKYGDSYLEFMRTRLTAVAGNVTSSGLGIESKLAQHVASKVEVIVHSAATTSFHEEYHTALKLNTLGPTNVLDFGKTCPRLQVFLHVSTAFVNGTRKGLTPETPFRMGDSIAKEKLGDSAPALDARKEVEDAQRMLEDRRHEDIETVARIMIDMGLERAKAFGWQDTYVFTKAMGEMLLDQQRGKVPVAIIRPSIVESTFSQPFPGWIEGHRMVDPLITGYGKGQLTGFLCEPESILDVVPCDMVVNAILAAMVKHSRQPGLAVYQVASSHRNPLFLKNFFSIVHDYFVEHPMLNEEETFVKGELKPFSFFPNLMLFKLFLRLSFALPLQVRFVMDNWVEASRSFASAEKRARYSKRLERIRKASEQYEQMAVVYEPYGFYRTRFCNTNSFKLYNQLSPEEQADFGFDVNQIDWQHYLCNIHVPGLRQYVMKGRFD